MHILKLTQIGNSVRAISRKDLLAQMRREKGDDFYVAETPDGLRITAHDSEFEEQMRLGHGIMKERSAALRELANEQLGVGLTARH